LASNRMNSLIKPTYFNVHIATIRPLAIPT
jgi:hypothetical protein